MQMSIRKSRETSGNQMRVQSKINMAREEEAKAIFYGLFSTGTCDALQLQWNLKL